MWDKKVWDEVVERMLEAVYEEWSKSEEHEYKRRREIHAYEILTSDLEREQTELLDEFLMEMGLRNERETLRVYHRGMRDCVSMLKNLGVLA